MALVRNEVVTAAMTNASPARGDMTDTYANSRSTVEPAQCSHRHRTRESHWGWFSAETICLTCRQAFDPYEEAQLRRREPTKRSAMGQSNQPKPH